jgi:hypothetical protein
VSRLGRALDELFDALAEFDPVLVPGDECVVVTRQLARAAKACEAAGARAALRACHVGCVERPAEFLAQAHGSGVHTARTAIDAVEQMLPETRDALLRGEVSCAQAAEIAEVPEHEAELLALARRKGLGPVRAAARKHRVAGIPAEKLHDKQVEAQRFRSWENELGNIAFAGELPPEIGVPLLSRLNAETDRLWRAASRDERTRPREWHAARAFARVCSGQGRGKADRADMVVVCDLNAYRRGYAEVGEPCHIIGGGPIPVSLAKELAKDAFLKAVLHDGVNIHTVAHFGRHRPMALQTALDLGAPPGFDGVTCTDCERKYFLEWDHVDPVANDGPTSFANLKPRCGPCHDKKTERDRRAGLLRRDRGP